MKIPESFTVDHTVMTAPAVRRAGIFPGPSGDIVSKYDIRLLTPNTDAVPTAGLHTLEHCLATLLHDYIDGIIDVSPMGCRTGFYMVCFGQPEEREILLAVMDSLNRIVAMKEGDVPGISEESCGNWRDHSLFTAQRYAEKIVEGWKS